MRLLFLWACDECAHKMRCMWPCAGAATADGSDPTDDISEKAKAGVDNVVEGVKDAAKKVTGGN